MDLFKTISAHLFSLEDFLWTYLGVPLIIGIGIYLSFYSRFFQIKQLPTVFKIFFGFFKFRSSGQGVHPLKAFFAAVGGCVGIGNVVGICTAVQIGGPGALFWIWITALVGMILKYSEVYLGILYRQPSSKGGYIGGPMLFLQKAFNMKWISSLVAILLCIYGVEVYQFTVVTKSVVTNFGINYYLIIAVFLGLIL